MTGGKEAPKFKVQSSKQAITEAPKFKVQSSKLGRLYTGRSGQRFDLEERTSVFSEDILTFCKNLKTDIVSKPVISQIVRSATSIGANYAEANNASSTKYFRNKVCIAKKEDQETKYWLRMLKTCYPNSQSRVEQLYKEVHELTLILQAIINKVDIKEGRSA